MEEDESGHRTAIRETCEELLIEEDQIELIAPMDVMSGPTGALLWAYLGELKNYEYSFWVLDNAKEPRRKGKMQLINANGIYGKMRKSLGNKRNEFSDAQVEQIMGLYKAFEDADPKLSKVFDNDDFGYITVDVRRPQRDEDGNPVKTARGKLVADKDLNDTENIPLTESVDEYMAREVLPYASDAWIEPRKQKKGQMLELRDGGTVGYEIPFTRHFYEYTPLRPSSEIMAEIRELETSIVEQLQKAGL